MSITYVENSRDANPVVVVEAVDMAALMAFEELQSDGEPDLIVELIDLYIDDAAKRLVEIRRAIGGADATVLRRAAHGLKGSSGNLGVRHVAEICEDLEHLPEHYSPKEVEALVQLLEHRFAKASEALAAERQRRLS